MPGIPGHFGDRESSLSLFSFIENVQKLPWGIFLWEFFLKYKLYGKNTVDQLRHVK